MAQAAGDSIAVLSSGADTSFVAHLAAALARSGYRMDDIAGATLHADPSAEPGILRRHLAEAAVTLVVLSPAAGASEQVRGEIEFAHLAGLAERIVPLIIAPTEVPHSLRSVAPVLFTAGDYDSAFARLLDRLTTLGAQPASAPFVVTAALAVQPPAPAAPEGGGEEPLAPETYLPPHPASEPPPMGGFPAPITNSWAAARPTAPALKEPAAEPPTPPFTTPTDASVATLGAPPATKTQPTVDQSCQTCDARLRPGYPRCGTCGMPIESPAAALAPAPLAAALPGSAPSTAQEQQDAPEAPPTPARGPVFDETQRVAGRLPRTAERERVTTPAPPPLPAAALPSFAPVPPPAASMPPAAIAAGAAPAPQPLAVPASEEVAFSTYYPREVAPQTWERLLVYISLAAAPILARVEADATERLAGRRDAFRGAMAPATTWLPRGTELTLVPSLPGYLFNPPSLTVRWEEEAQAHEFRLRAESAQPGFAANGSVAIFTGPLLRGEVPLSVFTRAPAGGAPGPKEYASMVARAYRRIFASYAHRDGEIVAACERTAEALGDHYLRDVRLLRSGEQWDERLLQAIAEADIFQLFWSKAAALSPAVEREWRHALILQPTRGAFIRPVYWTEQLYPPPQELSAIHFARMPHGAVGMPSARRGFFARLFRG